MKRLFIQKDLSFGKKRLIFIIFLRSLIEYGTFVLNRGWWNSKDEINNKWKTLYRGAITSILGVSIKSNKLLVEFEGDFPSIEKRIKFLKMSYINSIKKKSGGFKNKEIIKEILKGCSSEEEFKEVKDAYDEYLSYVKEKKETINEDRPSIYIPGYSFTRYLNDMDRTARRSERYKKIKESNLESSKHYIKYCIKSEDEAISSRLIHRDFIAINKLRLYFNLKPSREILINQNIEISTITRLVIEMIEKDDVNMKLSYITRSKRSELIAKINKLIGYTMGKFKISKMDSCTILFRKSSRKINQGQKKGSIRP